MQCSPNMTAPRHLLPREQEAHTFPPSLPSPAQLSKRPNIIAACESCRSHKSRCNGVRPRCETCINQGRECVYKTKELESRGAALKRKHKEMEQSLGRFASLQLLLQALQESNDENAATIFQFLRQGVDIDSILQHIRTGELLIQVHHAPEAKLRYEFPYQSKLPAVLLVQSNPYIKSLLYRATDNPHSSSISHSSERYHLESPYVTPYGAATIIDARLGMVKLSQWTSVSDDDELLRMLLKLYFLYEYQFFNCFHKDLFLDDLLSGSRQFCSPLLVNAILALASNCCNMVRDRFDFWNPHGLGYKFFAEARRLWDVQLHQDSLVTTVQAGLVMSVTYNLYAMDKVGMVYMVEAVRLAHDLQIFELPVAMGNGRSDRELRGFGFTAWSLYFWVSKKCYLLNTPPLVLLSPATPLPDPDVNPDWYGESLIIYPLDNKTYPLNHPHFFKEKCRLSCILNQLCLEFHDDKHNETNQHAQKNLQAHIVTLRTWQFLLPESLSAENIVLPYQLNLHLIYLTAMTNICETLVSRSASGNTDVLPDPIAGAASTLTFSWVCFESVLRIYYLHHGYEIPDGYLCHAMFQLACKALSQRSLIHSAAAAAGLNDADFVSPEDSTSPLVLTAKGLADQGKNYYLPRALFYIIENEMSTEDRSILHQYVKLFKDDSESLMARSEYISSQYPIGNASMSEKHDGRRLDHLTEEFTKLGIEKAHESANRSRGH